MIARIWRGRTPARLADAYHDYLLETGVPGYRGTAGNRGAMLLRRAHEETVEFVLLSLWESQDAIRAFAGDRFEVPVYFPEDARFLIEMPDGPGAIEHFEVLASCRG